MLPLIKGQPLTWIDLNYQGINWANINWANITWDNITWDTLTRPAPGASPRPNAPLD